MSKKKRKTLLWKITKEGNQNPSFLFGTMHLKSQVVIDKCASLIPYLNSCELFALEMALDEVDIAANPIQHVLKPNFSLKDSMPKKNYDKVSQLIEKKCGLNLALYDHLPPMIIIQAITEKILNTDAEQTLDSYLWSTAKEFDKICVGVETYQEQYNIMKAIPVDYQIKALKSTARNIPRFRKEIKKTVACYMDQRIDDLYLKTKKQLGKIRKLLLYDRNIRMTESIANLIEENNAVFIAIGAAHLGGGKGVISYLSKAGFKLRPILNWATTI